MLGVIRKLLFRPIWDWIQVEVTTQCNAFCTYCPRTAFGSVWDNRHMDMGVFSALEPWFDHSLFVHLQAWGEPLLHPNFFQMVTAAKKHDCFVASTTNGLLVDQAMAEKLVDSGLDILAFSLAGTGPGNDRIRRGAPLEKVLQGMEAINAAKKAKGSDRPYIHVAYILLRSNLEEVMGLPELLKRHGVRQVVITSLDFVPSAELESERVVFMDQAEDQEFLSRLSGMAEREAEQGMDIRFRLSREDARLKGCTENPMRAVVIGVDGCVSPCVFQGMPLHFDRVKDPCGSRLKKLCFGYVQQEPIGLIWSTPAYRLFRKNMSKGGPGHRCPGCPLE